jgi:hypothetical protein
VLVENCTVAGNGIGGYERIADVLLCAISGFKARIPLHIEDRLIYFLRSVVPHLRSIQLLMQLGP